MCGVNRGTSSSSPTSFFLDFSLFELGKDGECLGFWDGVPLLGVEVYKACRARWTGAWILDKGNARLGMEKRIHLGWQ